jgi:hypothetical protein
MQPLLLWNDAHWAAQFGQSLLLGALVGAGPAVALTRLRKRTGPRRVGKPGPPAASWLGRLSWPERVLLAAVLLVTLFGLGR